MAHAVLEASATLGPDHGETLLEARMAKLRPAGELIILSDLSVGMVGKQDEPDHHGTGSKHGRALSVFAE